MRLRERLHWFTVPPLAGAAFIFALMAWWPPLAGRVASPEGKMFFSTSTHSLATFCDPNGDGVIDGMDASALGIYWKGYPEPEVDCSHDGYVDSRDLAIMMGTWNGPIPALSTGALPQDIARDKGAGPFRLALPADRANGLGAKGDTFTALLMLDASPYRVGAGEAVVRYDGTRLGVKSVRTAPSIWTSWVERPASPYAGRLEFAGGRPGGFAGVGVLAEIVFEVKSAGDPALRIGDESRAYLADAAGTPIRSEEAGTGTSLQYDGPPPAAPASTIPSSVLIPAWEIPSPKGRRWMTDLSILDQTGEIAAYQIEDGDALVQQRSGAYVLQDASVASRNLQVLIRHENGREERVRVALSGLPGGQAPTFFTLLGFWVGVELALAALLFALFAKRR
jgi:hypothetical protein